MSWASKLLLLHGMLLLGDKAQNRIHVTAAAAAFSNDREHGAAATEVDQHLNPKLHSKITRGRAPARRPCRRAPWRGRWPAPPGSARSTGAGCPIGTASWAAAPAAHAPPASRTSASWLRLLTQLPASLFGINAFVMFKHGGNPFMQVESVCGSYAFILSDHLRQQHTSMLVRQLDQKTIETTQRCPVPG